MNSKFTREQIVALIAEHSYDSALVDALEYLLATLDSEPVAWVVGRDEIEEFNRGREIMVMRDGDDEQLEKIPLYRHAQPAPESELKAIVERLNASGYECGDGPVTVRNAAAVVDILLQQLDDAVQGSRLQRAPVVPEILPCSVELKPGLILGKGCKTATLLMALQNRADYRTEIDAMTPEERAEHDARIETFKAMLAAVPPAFNRKNI
ncbi:hypothetical protein [Klebsiella sp. PL-2018]|uniref:hypothetical protein n=1 Tax=Klebsiella sp. PL-2018 TaxID=2851540 RepID=UPI001C24ADE7|nr:hypothetical protein [Klebsiella sp. PL-2018]QXC99357.1 Phage EaA protein [Klebsiella sp. PL-2018]